MIKAKTRVTIITADAFGDLERRINKFLDHVNDLVDIKYRVVIPPYQHLGEGFSTIYTALIIYKVKR